MQFIHAWKKRLNHPTRLIPPQVVNDGPLFENVFEGKDIDLLSLPVPHWHEEDGGRYIGTADLRSRETLRKDGSIWAVTV